MFAKEIMTTKVVTVTPETQVPAIARLLIENGISALPVVNTDGELAGMVSEGDLIGRSGMQHVERRDWWLSMLAEGETLAPEFLDSVKSQGKAAHEIMSAPVITVKETTDIQEIARLLTEYHIKRVPVVRDNLVVGVVSRADVLQAFVNFSGQFPNPEPKQDKSFLSKALRTLDQHVHHRTPEAHLSKTDPDAKLTVKDFQTLVANFEHAKTLEQAEMHHRITEQHKQQVNELINRHIDDAGWNSMLHIAREIAQQGGKESLLLRFPNDLCSDGGRAINVGEEGWHETLRGEAAEIYLRWEQDLRPQGFHLSARTLEYPGGFPGDIGLFLVWGH